jgi:hypothetical protein
MWIINILQNLSSLLELRILVLTKKQAVFVSNEYMTQFGNLKRGCPADLQGELNAPEIRTIQ